MNSYEKSIAVSGVCKRHGKKDILRDVSFEANPGRVTAFLGPNGAGKSSTLRILLGLDYALAGTATFGGCHYARLENPLQKVGAVFDGIGGVRSRKVRTHLRMIAQSNNIAIQRVQEALHLVGLSDKSKERLGTLSLGEGQRLGLAAALLGNPQYLVLDEPMNGLDPGGIRWLRDFIKNQAAQGKTVLFSSHLLSEVDSIADDVVIIDHGSIVAAGKLATVKQDIQSLEDVFFSLTNGREA